MELLCPNCGEDMIDLHDDHTNPELECPGCGYVVLYEEIVANFLNLDDVNEFRAEHDLDPLTVLPKQNKSLIKNPKGA